MDILINKKYESYNYINRYTDVPYYFNTVDKKYIYGIGSQVLKNTSYTLHTVEPTDTLDYLALKYYNNPIYWWVIAYYNDIIDAFDPLINHYKALKIPNISGIEFGDER